jgi:hypothetical protein
MNIKELAEQAGFTQYDFWDQQKQFERFAELVRQDEREACAKLCESKSNDEYAVQEKLYHNERAWTDSCAAAIRARSKHD